MVSKNLVGPTLARMTLQIETNIDDMDPRLWPQVIDQILAAGALDAWVTPIIMKKGRPAFLFSVLCEQATAAEVRTAIFRETTTIGLREHTVGRHVLDRTLDHVEVGGQKIATKSSSLDGQVMNRSVEWDDVVAASIALGLSAKEVLAAATAAAVRDD